MGYSARVLLDSVSPAGVRLTTLEVTFPRFVLAEFNTHRVLSRNSASSRAIPTGKLIDRMLNDPVIPLEWGRNQAGMSADDVVTEEEAAQAERVWLQARRRGRGTRAPFARFQGSQTRTQSRPRTVLVAYGDRDGDRVGELLPASLRRQRPAGNSQSSDGDARRHRRQRTAGRRSRAMAFAARSGRRARARHRDRRRRFRRRAARAFRISRTKANARSKRTSNCTTA